MSGSVHAFRHQARLDGTPLKICKESDRANEDRYAFFKAQGVFWLTTLHDVLTTPPLVGAGRIFQNQFKFAMSLGGANVTTPTRWLVESIACGVRTRLVVLSVHG